MILLKLFRKLVTGRKGDVLGGFTFQMLSMAVIFVQQIALVPLFLASFPKSDYASWLVVQSFLGGFIIFNPGFADYYRQRIAEGFGLKDGILIVQRARELRFFQIMLAAVVSFVGCVFLYCDIFSYFGLNISSEVIYYMIILALYALVASIIKEIFSVFCIGLGKATYVSLFSVIGDVAGITICLASYKLIGVPALALSVFISAVLQCVLNLLLYAKLMRVYSNVKITDLRLSFTFTRDLWMTFIGRVARIFLLSSDLVLISKYFDSDTVLEYGLLKKILVFAGSFLDRFSNLLIAPVSSYFASGENKAGRHKMARNLSFFGFISSLGLWLFGICGSSFCITIWVGSEYTMPFQSIFLVSTFFASLAFLKWELLLRFSRGNFYQFAIIFVVLAVVVISLRFLCCNLQDAEGFYFSQALAATFFAGLIAINTRKYLNKYLISG